MSQEEKIIPFQIEKGIKPAGRGRKGSLPSDYFKIKATMNVMQKDDSFLFPINGYKVSSVKGWVQRGEKELSLEILDESLREKNKRVFSTSTIKDATNKETGIRIFRIA